MPLLRREVELYPLTLFEEARDDTPWWVAHVRSRQEKMLARRLLESCTPYYLPQSEKRWRRKGRSFSSFLPLFPGYLFFRAHFHARRQALKSNVIVKLLEVRDQEQLQQELHSLWCLQKAGAALVPHPYLATGDEVEILEGPFKGCRGRVLREKGRLRLVVSVTFLQRSVAAEFDREALAPVTFAGGPLLDGTAFR